MKKNSSSAASMKRIEKFLNASPKALWTGLFVGSLAYVLVRGMVPSPKIRLAILLLVLLALIIFIGVVFRKNGSDAKN